MFSKSQFQAIILGLAVLFLVIPGRVEGQTQKEARAAFAQGLKLYRQGNYRVAVSHVEKAVRLLRQLEGANSLIVANSQLLLADVYSNMGQFAKAERLYEELLSQSLKKLSKLVLEPLLKNIGNKEHWIISPDANLWLIPWEMLLLPDGRYAVEKHHIHYVNSGRYLVSKNKKLSTAARPPQIFADPDVDLDPGKAQQLASKQLDNAQKGIEVPRASRSLANYLGGFKRLSGTAAEAELIKPALARLNKMPVKANLGRRARKTLLKQVVSPKVLVLSTHGFFLPEKKTTPVGKNILFQLSSNNRLPGKAPENPLLRCGLLLAGANHFAKAKGEEDGILTGMDVLNMNLDGTELVVLSACETGIGDVRNGEGVAGLRQAFQLAGARSVLSSLWNVPDLATAKLMNGFFSNLAKGQSKSEALRNAQLKIIAERRKEFAAAHPVYWAAFTLTGQDTVTAPKLPEVQWLDYDKALKAGKAQKKPLAVFLANGEFGYHLVSKEEVLSAEILRTLQQDFVPVYVDMQTAAGRRLAKGFQISTPAGVALLDGATRRYLFWSYSKISNAELLTHLQKHRPEGGLSLSQGLLGR